MGLLRFLNDSFETYLLLIYDYWGSLMTQIPLEPIYNLL